MAIEFNEIERITVRYGPCDSSVVRANSLCSPLSSDLLQGFHAMRKSTCFKKRSLTALLSFVGLSFVTHGILVFGQMSLNSQNEPGWRRTSSGWEHAESLPAFTNTNVAPNELRFPALSITHETIHQTHRMALPLAITGFMACLGPWLLMRWPTLDQFARPV